MALDNTTPTAVMVYNTTWYVLRFRTPLLLALQKKGFQVHIIAPFDGAEKRLQEMGFSVSDFPITQHGKNPVRELKALLHLFKIFREIRPSVVLSYTIKCNLYSGIVSRFSSWRFLPSVVGLGRVFEQKSLLAKLCGRALSFAFKKAHRVFFQNKEDCETFVTQSIIRKEQGMVTPGSGVDLDALRPAFLTTNSGAGQVEGSLESGVETPVTFIIFGRLIPAKGFDYFLSAAEHLKKMYGDKIAFWIAGGLDGTDEDSKRLLNRIEAAHSSQLIHYWGHTDSVLDLVQRASVVVLPSTYNEGVPRSLLEGLALGKPIITTDWKGCRETVSTERLNGYLVAPNSVKSLTEAIQKCFESSSQEREKLGRNSRALAEEKFSQEVVLEAYLREVLLPISRVE